MIELRECLKSGQHIFYKIASAKINIYYITCSSGNIGVVVQASGHPKPLCISRNSRSITKKRKRRQNGINWALNCLNIHLFILKWHPAYLFLLYSDAMKILARKKFGYNVVLIVETGAKF